MKFVAYIEKRGTGMWMLFGLIAIVSAVWNVVFTAQKKNAEYFRFCSMSFTALTLCAFYHQDAQWVIHHDWYALEDTMPTMSVALWILTISSIGLNSISLWQKKKIYSDRHDKK